MKPDRTTNAIEFGLIAALYCIAALACLALIA